MSEGKWELKWEPIPDYGNNIPWEEFKQCCDKNLFIDYDGYGFLSTIDKMSNICVIPSDLFMPNFTYDPMFTHVVWFNR